MAGKINMTYFVLVISKSLYSKESVFSIIAVCFLKIYRLLKTLFWKQMLVFLEEEITYVSNKDPI